MMRHHSRKTRGKINKQVVEEADQPPTVISLEQRNTYGNTEAVILDYYVRDDGTITSYYASLCFVDFLTGRPHPAWLQEKQRRIETLTPILEADDYTSKHPAGCMNYRQALAAYRPYPTLFNERLRAKKYPFKQSKANFLDLPGEIRNKIYRCVLITKPGIEFAPKTNKGTDSDRPGAAWKESISQIRKLRRVLRFLRLNRQINREASDIYYGENDFRFSNRLGWQFLEAFLKTIGAANRARLRILSVNVPWSNYDFYGIDITSDWRDPDLFLDVDRAFESVSLSRDHVSHGGWARITESCLQMLADITKIDTIRFVFPTTLEISELLTCSEFLTPRLGTTLTKLSTGACKIELVHLRKNEAEPIGLIAEPMEIFSEDTENETYENYYSRLEVPYRDLRDVAKFLGWGFKTAVVSELGQYEVIEGPVSDSQEEQQRSAEGLS